MGLRKRTRFMAATTTGTGVFSESEHTRVDALWRDDLTIGVASARQPDELVVFELDHASGELRMTRRNDPVVDEPYELHPDYRATEARRWRTET